MSDSWALLVLDLFKGHATTEAGCPFTLSTRSSGGPRDLCFSGCGGQLLVRHTSPQPPLPVLSSWRNRAGRVAEEPLPLPVQRAHSEAITQ